MKKVFCIGLALLILFSLAACGSKTDTPTEEPAESSPQGAVVVDENLLTVDITLPATFFEEKDMSTFNADAYAAEQGFKKAILNDDGSVTVTMTKAKHRKLLEEIQGEYDTSFNDMVGSEHTPYIKSIKHSDNFDTITVEVDRAAYEAVSLELTPFTLGFGGMMYQVFSGDTLHVNVIIKDTDTGDIIKSVIYPDTINQDGSGTDSIF